MLVASLRKNGTLAPYFCAISAISTLSVDTITSSNSLLSNAERKGIQKGIQEGENKKAIEIAKNLLDILDNETISLKTGLSINEINKLRK